MSDTLAARIEKAVLDGDRSAARELAREALASDTTPRDALGLYLAGIEEVGRRWESGEFFLPELVGGAGAVIAALELLKPALAEAADPETAEDRVAVIGTVKGDIHDIGKSLVGSMLVARGLKVVDLGTDVPAAAFADAVEREGAHLVGLSALLTTTMLDQQAVIDELVSRGLRDRVVVLVGGAPVTGDWAQRIGADGTAPDAFKAADLAVELTTP